MNPKGPNHESAPDPTQEQAKHFTERPLAAPGLISYRYPSKDSWVMIGATDDADALREANRSISGEPAVLAKLQRWDGSRYAAVPNPVQPAASASMDAQATLEAVPNPALLREFSAQPPVARMVHYLDTLVGLMEDQALKDLEYGFTQADVYADLRTFHEAPGGGVHNPELVARLTNYLACWEGLTDDRSLRDLEYGFTNQDIRDALGEIGVGEEMKKAGFSPAWTSPGGCNEFERYPHGFGTDGQDRVERVTVGAAGELVADSRHLKHDGGLPYYNATSPALKTMAEVESWFGQDRAQALGDEALVEAVVPQTTEEIRAWLKNVMIPSVLDGDPETMTSGEVEAIWNKRWKGLVEKAETLAPTAEEVKDAQGWASRIRDHTKTWNLTPAQLVLYIQPIKGMAEKLVSDGKIRGPERIQ